MTAGSRLKSQVSVAVATYNGALHVEEQLRSILDQLGPVDEVVVVDDASTDGTPERVEAIGDQRIRMIVRETNRGHAATFETALTAARGGLLLLADQDDVWPRGRVAQMVRALEAKSVVAGNLAELVSGAPLRGPFGQRTWTLGPTPQGQGWGTLIGLGFSNVPYYGSAMGLRASFRNVILPFPAAAVELHDAWLGINGLVHGEMGHVRAVVTLRRLHGANTSGTINRPRSPIRVIHGRRMFLQMVAEARRRRRGGLIDHQY